MTNTNNVPVRPGGPSGWQDSNARGQQTAGGNQPRPCRFWPKGSCNSGANCKYPHEGPSGAQGGGQNNQAGGGSDTRGANSGCHWATECRDFARGRCRRAQGQCRFSHAPAPTSAGYGPQRSEGRNSQRQAPYESPQKKQSPNPCFSFQKGECKRGDNCRFSHANESPRKQGKNKTARKEQQALVAQVALQGSQLAAVMAENDGHRAAAAKAAEMVETRRTLTSMLSSLRQTQDKDGTSTFFLDPTALNH
jgi:hypothetical protein